MKNIYFITFLILFSYIYSFCRDCCREFIALTHSIDTNSKYYKSEITFDWTSEDEYDLNIPFTKLGKVGDISPFLVNATFVEFSKKSNGKYVENNLVEIEDYDAFYNYNKKELKFQGYPVAKEIPEGECKLIDNVLRTSINPAFLKANANKVDEVFKYYFGWFECGGEYQQRLKISQIMNSIINGKLYKFNKYILFIMTALIF